LASNQNIRIAQAYHEATKLAYINLRNKPPLYKSYTNAPVIPLPTNFSTPETSTLAAVARLEPEGPASLDLTTLGRLLYLSAGVIRKRSLPQVGEVHYRAAASAGALYPIETYLVCRDLPGLDAGVYHFSPEDFSLRQLRCGNYLGELAGASGGHPDLAQSVATIVFTAIFWRSAWKYRARGYRYCLWDNGTMTANLMATAAASRLPACLVVGFADERVDRLIGVDGEREASICLVSLGRDLTPQPPAGSPGLTPISAQAVVAATEEEIDYPEIRQMHAASLLRDETEAAGWRGGLALPLPQGRGSFYPLQPPQAGGLNPKGLGETVLERGSTRRFSREPISYPQLSAILDSATRGVPADFLSSEGASLLDLYIIANAVEDIPSGAYFFSPRRGGLELLQEGDLREEAGHLCFEQALGADASVVVFFLADLEKILGRYGNRGYRAAQMEAGVLGGKIYLCAHSLGLGASGITFYDDDVTDFFSPHAAGKSPIFVVTLGNPAPQNRVRPFRSRVAVRLDALARGAKNAPGQLRSAS
jgi:SagB-type dehydrogenase family enzyme